MARLEKRRFDKFLKIYQVCVLRLHLLQNQMPMSAMLAPANIQWNDILKALRNRQCVLFLGPDLLPGLNLYTELCRFLGGTPSAEPPSLPQDVAACYPNEELFPFAHPAARMNVCFRLDDFYASWFA
jgi:hypothetical protein